MNEGLNTEGIVHTYTHSHSLLYTYCKLSFYNHCLWLGLFRMAGAEPDIKKLKKLVENGLLLHYLIAYFQSHGLFFDLYGNLKMCCSIYYDIRSY